MMNSFTQEDLLQYLYKETSPEKTAAIKAALESDWILYENFQILSQGLDQLKPITLSPRKKSVDSILRYAEKAIEEISQPA